MKNRPPTLTEIRKWPPTCNIEDAALALGVSRSSLYMAVREGVAPVTVNVPVPAFVSVNVCVPLLPTATLPKATLAGLIVS